MWPYVAGAIVAFGGLWKLVAILRCRREDIPTVVSAITSLFTLQLPRTKQDLKSPGNDTSALSPEPGPQIPQPPRP